MTKAELKSELRLVLSNHLYSAIIIFACLYMGKGLKALLGGLPASIYGMMIFAILLRIGVLSEKRISPCIGVYVKYMSIAFIPAVLGIMEYGDLLKSMGLQILFVAVVTTVLGIVLAGLFAQYLFSEKPSSYQGLD